MKSYFVTGTDTGVGKTLITALLANYLSAKNSKVITQKWIQTGSKDINSSDDIEYHLNFFNNPKISKNKKIKKEMCPYNFKFPGSPHLAARLENKTIDKNKIIESYEYLKKYFDSIIVEGSGGVLVPYNDSDFLIDIAKELKLPVIVVSDNKLGSINHTLLTIESLKNRKIKIEGIIFTNSRNSKNKIIKKENIEIISKILKDVKILGEIKYNTDKQKLIKNFKKIWDKHEENYGK